MRIQVSSHSSFGQATYKAQHMNSTLILQCTDTSTSVQRAAPHMLRCSVRHMHLLQQLP
jgi:hypothetical protein